jgi:hypothetical protein
MIEDKYIHLFGKLGVGDHLGDLDADKNMLLK